MITCINEIVMDENNNFTALGKARADIQTTLDKANYNILDLNVHRLKSEIILDSSIPFVFKKIIKSL